MTCGLSLAVATGDVLLGGLARVPHGYVKVIAVVCVCTHALNVSWQVHTHACARDGSLRGVAITNDAG